MPDIFIDCEFDQNGIFLLGAHCPGVTNEHRRFQLYNNELAIKKFINFVNRCGTGNTLLFCHGPDIGLIENQFNINLKDQLPCINVITAFNTFTRFKNFALGYLARQLDLGEWRDPIEAGQVGTRWNTRTAENRERVLNYNWDDCVILSRAVGHLRMGRNPRVTNNDFIAIRMQR